MIERRTSLSATKNKKETLFINTVTPYKSKDVNSDIIINTNSSRQILSPSILSQHAINKAKSLLNRNSIGLVSPESAVSAEEHYDIERYPQHDSGSLNLICMNTSSDYETNENNRSKASPDNKRIHVSLLQGLSFEHGDSKYEDVGIDDIIRNIISNDVAWCKVREEIRNKNLVTSLGVIEACLSIFQEEALKLREQRVEEAKQAESQNMSKYSKLRKRLSIFKGQV